MQPVLFAFNDRKILTDVVLFIKLVLSLEFMGRDFFSKNEEIN